MYVGLLGRFSTAPTPIPIIEHNPVFGLVV